MMDLNPGSMISGTFRVFKVTIGLLKFLFFTIPNNILKTPLAGFCLFYYWGVISIFEKFYRAMTGEPRSSILWGTRFGALLMFLISLVVTIICFAFRKHLELNPDAKYSDFFKMIFAKLGMKKEQERNSVNEKYKGNTEKINQIFFGKQDDTYITANIFKREYAGILLIGGPGSGKSADVVANSLILAQNNNNVETLKEKQTVLCMDIKGELEPIYRKSHPDHNIIIFNPKDEMNGYNFDPFYRMKNCKDSNPTTEALNLAGSILPFSGNGDDKYWTGNAQSLLAGAFLYYGIEQGMSFSDVMVHVNKTSPKVIVEEIMSGDREDAIMCVNHFATMKDTELGSIYSSMKPTKIFALDENLRRVFGESSNIGKTFNASDIENVDALFIQMNTKDINSSFGRASSSIVISQIMDVLMERNEFEEHSTITLFLDEAPQYLSNINMNASDPNGSGRVQSLLAVGRSLGIITMLCAQSFQDLKKAVGDTESKIISDNCKLQYILEIQDPQTQKYFAEKLGQYEEIMRSNSVSKNNGITLNANNSISASLQEKWRIRPEEMRTLTSLPTKYGFGKGLLFYNEGACLVDKVPYFADRETGEYYDDLFNPAVSEIYNTVNTSDFRVCMHCYAICDSTDTYCSECGENMNLVPQKKKCNNCGTYNSKDNNFCEVCGEKLSE